MLKIGIVGKCTAQGVADCLQLLVPDADVFCADIAHTVRTPEQADAALEVLRGRDMIFTSLIIKDRVGRLQTAQLKEEHSNIIEWPAFRFNAFQPDMVTDYTPTVDGRRLFGPFGGPFSAICVLGSLLKLPPSRVLRLFNAYIYSALGYFKRYDEAIQELQIRFAKLGFPLPIAEWQSNGPFMHHYNHPKVHVLRSIAETLCRKAEIRANFSAPLPPDRFAGKGYWPVYPEIASRIGCPVEAMEFRGPVGDPVDLAGMVHGTHDILKDVDPAILKHPRLDRQLEILQKEIRV